MQSSSLKTIKNVTGAPQSIVMNGQQFTVAAFGEETFDSAIADKFLAICAPALIDSSEQLGATYAPELAQQTIWVANLTGNPDAPDEVNERRVGQDRKWTDVKVKNPNKEPRTLAREMKGGHKAYIAKDGGLVQLSLPSTQWEIPPFRRRPMPAIAADWFLNRDAHGGGSRGAAIKSRPQSEFEPDMSWPLDDMRIYLRFVDADANLGIGEDELSKTAIKKKWDAKVVAEELRKAKQACFKRLYFRLVNPDYRLPTREEFMEVKLGKSAEQMAEEQVTALLEKSQKATEGLSKSE